MQTEHAYERHGKEGAGGRPAALAPCARARASMAVTVCGTYERKGGRSGPCQAFEGRRRKGEEEEKRSSVRRTHMARCKVRHSNVRFVGRRRHRNEERRGECEIERGECTGGTSSSLWGRCWAHHVSQKRIASSCTLSGRLRMSSVRRDSVCGDSERETTRVR